MKLSKAFAAFRQSLITDIQHRIQSELVPQFNAECEDIRRRVTEDFATYKNQAKADNLKKALTYDLVMRRQGVIKTAEAQMIDAITTRLARDGADTEVEIIPHPKKEGKTKEVLKALFPDGSIARVPQGLWIDFGQFDRV